MPQARYGVPCLDGDHPSGQPQACSRLGKESVTKKKRAICVPYKREYFLNPGHPQTKEYLMSLVREVVERYDVDGIHFDYLRYPENAPPFSRQLRLPQIQQRTQPCPMAQRQPDGNSTLYI